MDQLEMNYTENAFKQNFTHGLMLTLVRKYEQSQSFLTGTQGLLSFLGSNSGQPKR